LSTTTTFELVEQFISDKFCKEDRALKSVADSLSDAGISNISVSPTLGKLLYLLASLTQAKRVLEIGTLGGYSTIWLARGVANGGSVLSLEFSPQHAELAQANLRRARLDKIAKVQVGDAREILEGMARKGAGPFDLVFIDADKESYPRYLQLSLKLTHSGSIIVADNVVRKGAVLSKESDDPRVVAVRKFLDTLSGTKSLQTTVLQTVGAKGHDGVSISVVTGPASRRNGKPPRRRSR